MNRSNPELRDPLVPFFSTIRDIQQNWQWFLALGTILIVLGFLAVGAATYTSLMTVVFLGVILLIGGIAKLVYSFGSENGVVFFPLY